VAASAPIIGVGFGTFEKTYDWFKGGYLSTGNERSAHNTALRLFAETGLIGLLTALAFVGSLLIAGIRFLRTRREDPEWFMVFSLVLSLVSFFMMSLTLDQMFEPHFWITAGIVLAFLHLSHKEPSPPERSQDGV